MTDSDANDIKVDASLCGGSDQQKEVKKWDNKERMNKNGYIFMYNIP